MNRSHVEYMTPCSRSLIYCTDEITWSLGTALTQHYCAWVLSRLHPVTTTPPVHKIIINSVMPLEAFTKAVLRKICLLSCSSAEPSHTPQTRCHVMQSCAGLECQGGQTAPANPTESHHSVAVSRYANVCEESVSQFEGYASSTAPHSKKVLGSDPLCRCGFTPGAPDSTQNPKKGRWGEYEIQNCPGLCLVEMCARLYRINIMRVKQH